MAFGRGFWGRLRELLVHHQTAPLPHLFNFLSPNHDLFLLCLEFFRGEPVVQALGESIRGSGSLFPIGLCYGRGAKGLGLGPTKPNRQSYRGKELSCGGRTQSGKPLLNPPLPRRYANHGENKTKIKNFFNRKMIEPNNGFFRFYQKKSFNITLP